MMSSEVLSYLLSLSYCYPFHSTTVQRPFPLVTFKFNYFLKIWSFSTDSAKMHKCRHFEKIQFILSIIVVATFVFYYLTLFYFLFIITR